MSTRRSNRLPPTPSLSERKRALFPDLSPSVTSPSGSTPSTVTTPHAGQFNLTGKLSPIMDEERTPSVRNLNLNVPRSPVYLSGDSSDLGHMSPLQLSSSPERYDSPCLDTPQHLLARPRFFSPKSLTFENILSKDNSNHSSEHFDNTIIKRHNLTENSKNDSSEILCKHKEHFDENCKENYGDELPTHPLFSPTKSTNILIEMAINQKEDTTIPETPEKMSPSQILKTPQEILLNPSPPRINARKSLVELNLESPVEVDSYPQKRLREDLGISPSSPHRKHIKLDDVPKARAALFVDANTSISPKSFYSKALSTTNLASKFHARAQRPAMISNKKSYKRSSRSKKFGEINFGVKHGIRKPKPRKPILNHSKASVLRTVINVNSPLRERLEVLGTKNGTPKKINKPAVKALPETQVRKMDGLLKNISTKVLSASKVESQGNRNMEYSISLKAINKIKSEQVPSTSEPVRKFFKSKRSYTNKVINLQDNIHINISETTEAFAPPMKKAKLIETFQPNPEDLQILDSTQDLSAEQHEVSKIIADWTESDEEEEEQKYQLPENTNLDLQTIQTELEIIDLKLAALQQPNTLFDMDTKHIIPDSVDMDTKHIIPDSVVSDMNVDNFNTSALTDVKYQATEDNLVYRTPIDNMLLSPTSQISDMTSVLALNSPRPPVNILSVQSNIETQEMNSTKDQKLFPLFYKGNCQASNIAPSTSREKNVWKASGQSQLQIDAGQKKFGLTQCHECTLVYQIGEPEDEILHEKYHNSYHVLKFKGWRNEKIVCTIGNLGRILHVTPANKGWHRRVFDLLDVVDRDLGFVQNTNEIRTMGDAQVFLMADSKQILGMIMAVPLSVAHKLLTVGEIHCCSVEAYPVKCGVSRIWVAPSHRRKGIARALLNAVRFNFQYGAILTVSEIAFSTPTSDGQALAKSFTGVDDFMVFSNL